MDDINYLPSRGDADVDEIPGTPSSSTQSCLSRERDRVTRDVAQSASMQKILGGPRRDAIFTAVLRRSCLHLRPIGGGEQREPIQDLALSSRRLGPAGRHSTSVASVALSTPERGYRRNSAVQVRNKIR